MKRRITLLICSIAAIIFICFKSNAQTLEIEKSHKLSKDAKKGFLGSYQYDEAAKQYTLVFQHDSKKEIVFETMKFDYDFNLLSDNSETLTLINAKKKYDFVEYDEEEWKNPVVVRVDANMMGAGNVVLRKGTISREWIKPTTTFSVSGNWITTTTTSGYYKYNFNETEKITPKIEMGLTVDPRTPNFVKKLIENQSKKVFLVGYMTDEPAIDYQLGKRHYYPNVGKVAYFSSRKAFSSASGDIVVIGKQTIAYDTAFICRYVALKYSAADFAEKNRKMIEFRYGNDIIYKQILPDKTYAMIFAPMPKISVKPGKPNPNSRAYTFVRVDNDGNIKERIDFDSPSSKWDISNIEIVNGDMYIYGPAMQANNDKYYSEQYAKKYDNYQLMKISGGKIAFLTSTKLDEFESKTKLASSVKKFDKFEGGNFEIGLLSFASNGDILLSGQDLDAGPKYGNIRLFQFSSNGMFKAQYGYKLQESSKEATANGTIHAEFENADKTLTWLIYEFNGATEEKMLIYPRVATIDLNNMTVSEFGQYGYTKDKEFFLDNSRPVLFIDNNKKAVFFGADKKNKEIWFCRVKLGK